MSTTFLCFYGCCLTAMDFTTQKKIKKLLSKPFFQKLGKQYHKRMPLFIRKKIKKKHQKFEQNPKRFLIFLTGQSAVGLIGSYWMKKHRVFERALGMATKRHPNSIGKFVKGHKNLTRKILKIAPKRVFKLAANNTAKIPGIKTGFNSLKKVLKVILRNIRITII